MADWGPSSDSYCVLCAMDPRPVVPAACQSRVVEFANMQTSGVSIFDHTIIYIFLIAIGVHIYTG